MSFSVSQILGWTGGRLANAEALGPAVEAIRVERPVPLGVSRPTDLAFFYNKAYEAEARTANPGVLITAEPFLKPIEASGHPLWKTAAVVSCSDPYLAMALLSEKFAECLSTVAHTVSTVAETEVHPSAILDPSAEIGHRVRIGPHCVIEAGARIGDDTVLYPGCYVGPDVRIGQRCVLFPGVILYEWTQIGDRVRIHAGSVLGSDGFGYAQRREGKQVVGHQKIFHLGRVVVGDDAELGANVCVDRSTFGETRIGCNAKLDNDVHLGHNVILDEGAVICGGTALAGRARIGRYAFVGGMTGITNDVYVGDGASVGAVTLVTKDVAAGSTAVGVPAREYREHFKIHAMLNRMLDEKKKGGKNE
ncbi:MAG: UDP-3-O-(3-hydroxymyristoyl)glucosamine N-acyltransferase [Oligoflexia bacterium]|nr:UDP-3-O-(3-hydroxymyristoyl)glucosamine N-acyltransferase [Oligoflexia bacterium]